MFKMFYEEERQQKDGRRADKTTEHLLQLLSDIWNEKRLHIKR